MHLLDLLFGLAGGGLAGWFLARGARPVTSAFPDAPIPVAATPEPEVLIDHLPVPALLLHAEGALWHANREARQHFGDSLSAVARHPAIHQVLEQFIAGDARADRLVPDLSNDAQSHPHATDGRVTILLELDVPVRRVVEASFSRLPDISMPAPRVDEIRGGVKSAPRAVVVVLDDHSEIDAVNRMRADFVAHASHELRTPLASLVGFIETLQGPAAADPPAQQQFLGIMAAQAARMQRLIDRLLYLSRVQRLEHMRPKEIVSAMDVIDRLTEETAILMRNAEASLTLALPDDDFFFPGDEDQLVQVLLNLVENAVKYGGKGVRVAVTAHAEPNGVRFVVTDTGPGIEARHLPRLTERFYRVESHGAAQVPGTGLGLAIVKHIVDRHGGKLLIESTVGQGTGCSVWLPSAN